MSKTWTDEERKAFGAKMQQAKLAKQQEKEDGEEIKQETQTDLNQVVKQLMEEVASLKAERGKVSPSEGLSDTARIMGASIGAQGVQGEQVKHSLSAQDYPDPTERLYDEPVLSRHGLRENYEIRFAVEGSHYEANGIRYAEPRFMVELHRKLFNDDGTPKLGKSGRQQVAFRSRQFQHEDEVAARMAARKLGLEGTFPSFKEMMDEMRYAQMRKWLLDTFNPPEDPVVESNEAVIDNRVTMISDSAKEVIVTPEQAGRIAASIDSKT